MRICGSCRVKVAAQLDSQIHMHAYSTSTTADEVLGQKRGTKDCAVLVSCYAMLCYAMLCYAMLCYVLLNDY